MDNSFLREKTARQIDGAVERVLSDLGNPEPPLDLSQVRRLLRIDLGYYTSTDQGLLKEVVHAARMGGVTLFEGMLKLGDAIRRWDLKALYQPDVRRILIDEDQPKAKWRWSESHEIVHSLITWHGPLMNVDTSVTLAPDCIMEMESEANFGSGRLLFLRDKFVEEARSVEPSWHNIRALSDRYRNTMTSTLWRFVESLDTPAFGVVGYLPFHNQRPEGERCCKYFIRSRRFRDEFSTFSDAQAVDIFESYCSSARGGPLGRKVAVIVDDRGTEHEFQFESFSNTHEALTLATHMRIKPFSILVPNIISAEN